MSLEFYFRWSSTVAFKEIFKIYLKYWGSVEFFCLWSSTVSNPSLLTARCHCLQLILS
jgi:hypothetical protein